MLAIAGGKGGVGKSTTALGLALDVAARRGDCLAVDADRDMPDLHALAGVPNEPTVAALVGEGAGDDPGTGERPVSAVARRAPGGGARVVPAAPGVERGALRRALRRLSCAGRPVVVDCPAGAGADAADPLRLADACVVVTRPTPAGLRDGAKTAAMARAVETPVVGAVLSRADRADGVSRLFDAPAVAVPRVDEPLGDPAAVRARRRLLAEMEWPGPTDGSGPEVPRNRGREGAGGGRSGPNDRGRRGPQNRR